MTYGTIGAMKTPLIIVGALVICVGVLVYAFVFRSPNIGDSVQNSVFSQEQHSQNNNMQQNKELEITDLRVGTGAAAKIGNTVVVQYKGMLENGTEFDSSYKRSEPFEFTLGKGEVIPGWDQGVLGMKVGGKRKLVIPPQLGYGSRDLGVIPPDSTLIFEIELVGIK